MAIRKILIFAGLSAFLIMPSCESDNKKPHIYTLKGKVKPTENEIRLPHEHLLVDFIGANRISFERWDKTE
ncbi:MAG: hypothetical protein ACOCWA_02145 [Bacteroidota bacterium]